MPPSVPIPALIKEWLHQDDKGRDLKAIRALAKADRYYLLVRVLGRTDCLHDWIYARCREVEAAPDGHIDIWAREHYKSTIITYAGCIQEVLRNPEVTIGIFSHTKKVAGKFLMQIMFEFENNALLKKAFSDVLYSDPKNEAPRWSVEGGILVKRTGNPKEATIEAWGLVDGSPIGAHFDLMVEDDVVVPSSVGTPEQIVKTTEAQAMASSLSKEGGRTWIVGTRYHFADTYDSIMQRKAAVPRVYPATHNGDKDGKPVLFSPAEWAKRKRQNTDSTIATQMLANPLAGVNRMFDITHLQVYEVRPRTLMGYLLVDPARSKKKGSANTAMAVIGMDAAGNKYFLDGVDHRMDLMERWQWLRDLRRKWAAEPGMMGLVVGYETYGAQADMDYFKEKMEIDQEWFDIVELAWPREDEGSKVDRIGRLVPDVKGRRFYVPYATNTERYTKLQRQMIAAGYEYRVSRPIKRLDEEKRLYDVVEHLKMQFGYFPFGGRVDLIDAVARIYDADPHPPQHVDPIDLEPEVV